MPAGGRRALLPVVRRSDRSGAGEWRRGASRTSLGSTGAAGGGPPARQPRVAAGRGISGISGHRHDPHPLDLRAPRGNSGPGPVFDPPHAGRAPRLGARDGGRLHRPLHAAGSRRDARREGHAPRLALLPGRRVGTEVAGHQRPGGGRDHRARLASAGALSRRHAALVSLDSRAHRSDVDPAGAAAERRPDRAAHRTQPRQGRTVAAPPWPAGVGRGPDGGGDLGRDGPDRRGAVSRGESRGARAQSAHRAAGAPGHGLGIFVFGRCTGVVDVGRHVRRPMRCHAPLHRSDRRLGGRGAGRLCLGRRAAGLVGGRMVSPVAGDASRGRARAVATDPHVGNRGRDLDRNRCGCHGWGSPGLSTAHGAQGDGGGDGPWLWDRHPESDRQGARLRRRTAGSSRGGPAWHGGRSVERGGVENRHARHLASRHRPFQCRAGTARAVSRGRGRGFGGLSAQ